MIEVLAPNKGYVVRIAREVGMVTFEEVTFFNDWASAHNYLWRNK